MTLSVLIIDDDPGMRSVLRKIIDNMDEVKCSGEAADGEQGLRLCLELEPDIVFMDVDMPVMNGIEAAGCIIESLPNTRLVFCTAHSKYMPDAFELYATDYLIKPFKTDRVRQTIRRIHKEQVKKRTSPVKTIMLKNREGMTFLPVNEILMVYRENRVTNIITADAVNAVHTTSESLGDIWKRLEGGDFFKSHRAYIINMSAITKIHPYGRWTYNVALKGTTKTALITHEKLEELQELLKV